jgi:hypothetical protein
MPFHIQHCGYDINVIILDKQISTKIKKLVYPILNYIHGTELKHKKGQLLATLQNFKKITLCMQVRCIISPPNTSIKKQQ